MCGLIEILGKRNVQDRIVDGLSRLEYRVYDSAGVAIMSDVKASDSKVMANRYAHISRLLQMGQTWIICRIGQNPRQLNK